MKRSIILACIVLLVSLKSEGQIDKGDWLVGGSATFSSQSQSNPIVKMNTIVFDMSLNAGYFLKNRFAVGLRPDYSLENFKRNGGSLTKTHSLNVGPFFRYYYFPNNQRANFFAEGSYAYCMGTYAGKTSHANKYAFLGGPVIFLNEAVGLEFTVGYSVQRTHEDINHRVGILQTGIGLQFHIAPINKQP